MAGTGKRGDAKKPSIWKDKDYFGKRGFKKKGIKRIIKGINISEVDQQIEKWADSKLAKREKDFFMVDLQKLGYNKLLGDGKATKKMQIKVGIASPKAAEKIKAAGGEVVSADKE